MLTPLFKRRQGYASCLLLSIAFLISLTGCARKDNFSSIEEYVAYTNSAQSGFTQATRSGELAITVKYLTPAYLAYVEASNSGLPLSAIDSLALLYERSLTFQVVLQPASPKDNLHTIIHGKAKGEKETAAQLTSLNHEMGEYVKLVFAADTLAPVLASLESTFEMDRKLSFLFVYEKTPALERYKAGNIRFTLTRNFFLDREAILEFNPNELHHYPSLHL